MEGDNLNWSIEYYEKNTEECTEFLKVPENREKIALLNTSPLHNFKNGQLVQYQGMVQDMFNAEFYYSQYSVKNRDTGDVINKTGKFRDITQCGDNEELLLEHETSIPSERLVFFCVPLPGLNSWVKNSGESNETIPKPGTSGQTNNLKRNMEDVDMETDESEQQSLKRKSTEFKIPEIPGNQSGVNYDNDKYFPIPNQTGLPCIVKIYEDEDKCDIVLNDRIDVVGFLNLDPALEATWADSDAEDKAIHPPPSLVPRIHAIAVNKLQHSNPLLKQEFLFGDIIAEAEKTRSDLHLVLTQLLFGDTVAADYIICHLLSRIYFRNDLHTLGKFSLNISNVISNNFAERLYEILQNLVTNSQYIPLSIQTLNDSSFIPKKNYDTNRLWSGRLQLCDDTHLLLDETKLAEGKLNHVGCLNMAALQTVIRDQEIGYDFGYYPVKYNTNIPVLVMSEGKSLFETDVKLKLKPDLSMASTIDETFEAARFYLNKQLSEKIRIYLTSMRLQKFDMSEEMMKKIGEDYVSMRQQDRKVSSGDLHTLLVLSRLLALSYGRTVLTPEDWSKAVDMETERKLRSS